jgi:hypothetical protein
MLNAMTRPHATYGVDALLALHRELQAEAGR